MISAHDHTEMIQVPKKGYIKLVQEHQDMAARLLVVEPLLVKLKRMLFGRKSERFTEDPALQDTTPQDAVKQYPDPQGLVKIETGPQETNPQKTSATELPPEEVELIDFLSPIKKGKAAKKGHSRSPIAKNIPRVEEVVFPAEDITGWKIIGHEKTQILELIPKKVYVRKIIRFKYLSPDGTRIVIADLPSLPIYRGHVGASLLADLIVSKWFDHLPLHRQIQIYERLGITLAASTINGWLEYTGNELEAVYNQMRKKAFAGNYIQMDETGMNVMTEDHPGSVFKGTFWAIHAPLEGVALFKYDKSHGGQIPRDLLEGFHGAVQTDGHSLYKFLDTPPWTEWIITLGCWAHARRHMEESLTNEPLKVPKILAVIQRLYQVERIARGKKLSPEQTRELRQRFSVPILEALHVCLKKEQEHLEAPSSTYGKAVNYILNHWNRLTRYTQNGNWNIDNNPIENTIRAAAMGKKNFLFTGNHEAAQRSAMMYSFMATCKIHGVNPQKWLEWVLCKLPGCKASEIESLLPASYKASLAAGPPKSGNLAGWVSSSA
jgi:transposase